MDVHLVDGTYELFRYHFAVPPPRQDDGSRSAPTRGVVGSMLMLLEDGATHVGVATDHVIESFRNDLWPGYKTARAWTRELLAQFPLLEEALDARSASRCGRWSSSRPTTRSARPRGSPRPTTRVEQVLSARPTRTSASASGGKVVQFDRRQTSLLDEAAVSGEVRRRPGVDSRLPRAGRRQR